MIPQAVKAALVADLDSRINTNGVGAITGAIINDWLNDLLTSVLPTIHEGASAPPDDPDKRFWLDTSDGKIKVRDRTQTGSPFVPILVKLASGETNLVIDETTNELSLNLGSVINRLSQEFLSSSTNILDWTQAQDLPNSNSLIDVFLNGQKISTTMWTRTGTNQITISTDVHFNGANYEITAFV